MEVLWEDIRGKTGQETKVIGLRLERSRDTPADGLVCQMVCSQPLEELRRIVVADGENVLFEGSPDKQEQQAWGNRQRVWITARSRGALLLDNEAMPQVYESPALEQVFLRHCSPYGVVNGVRAARFSGQYIVGKGVSQWEAFARLCRQMTGIVPFLDGNTVVTQRKEPGSWRFVAEETPNLLELRQIFRRSEVISQVFLRDSSGSYRTVVQNEEAIQKGICRRSFYVPSSQWELLGDGGGRELLRKSAQRWETWQAVLLGSPKICIGDLAYCCDRYGRVFYGMVDQVRLQYSGSSCRTSVMIQKE